MRWLEDSEGVVHVGCEALCNFADARIGQTPNKSEHLPVITFVKNEANAVICGYDAGNANSVSQLILDSEVWVVAVASELGEDWQVSTVLDVTR